MADKTAHGRPPVGLLGPVRLFDESGIEIVPRPQARSLLAILALRRRQVVPHEVLIDEIGIHPRTDQKPAVSLQRVVSDLRADLGRAFDRPPADVLLRTEAGYMLDVKDEAIDVSALQAAVSRARDLHARRRSHEAAVILRRAAGSVRGPALTDVDYDHVQRDRDVLDDRVIDLLQLAAAIDLDLCRYRRLVGLLTPFVGHDSAYDLLRPSLARALWGSGEHGAARRVAFGRHPELRRTAIPPDLREVRDAIRRGSLDLKPETSAESNLPRRFASSFIGRERLLEHVVGLLPDHSIVTLVGAGGIGKTRLALEVALATETEWEDGPRWIDLAHAVTKTQAFVAVLAALRSSPMGDDPVDDVVSALRDVHCLLVVDNCDQVLAELRGLLDAIVTACPHVTIVSTSRQPIVVDGEAIVVVPPLDTAVDPLVTAESATEMPALRLLVERASAGFTLSQEDLDDAIALVRMLDGLPLAIELVAPRLRGSSVSETLRACASAGLRLRASRSSKTPHHETMRACIEWTYQSLSPAEQHLLTKLTVFAGSFSLDAVRNVLADGHPVDDMDELVIGLADRSMLAVEISRSETRYRMLEVIREHASQFAEPKPMSTLRSRHLEWYRQIAEASRSLLEGPGVTDALVDLEADHSNLQVALEWSVDNDPEAGHRLARSLVLFWSLRRHYRVARHWLERVSSRGEQVSPALRADVLLVRTHLAAEQGEDDTALELIAEAQRIAERIGDADLVARCVGTSAEISMRQCDYVAARIGLEQVRPHWIESGNALLTSICDLVLARIDLIEEKIDDGTRGLEKCIVTFREGGLQQLLAEALVLRAELDVRNTDLDLAKRHLREALNIQLELNDAGSIADSVRLLARIRRDADPRSAARLIGFADALRRGHGVGVSSHDQKEIADEVAALRSLIGEDAHDAEFLAGAEMQEQEGLNLVVSLLES